MHPCPGLSFVSSYANHPQSGMAATLSNTMPVVRVRSNSDAKERLGNMPAKCRFPEPPAPTISQKQQSPSVPLHISGDTGLTPVSAEPYNQVVVAALQLLCDSLQTGRSDRDQPCCMRGSGWSGCRSMRTGNPPTRRQRRSPKDPEGAPHST